MRQNRLSQRLKSKLDSFGFDALIKGVSTLVEENPEIIQEKDPADARTDGEVAHIDAALDPIAMPSGSELIAEVEAAEPISVLHSPIRDDERIESAQFVKPSEHHAPSTTAVLDIEALVVGPSEALDSPMPTRAHAEPPARVVAPEPLREALIALSCRLSQEAGRMAAALEQRDAEEAGFYLAHVNQILELLHTLDARGEMARQLRVPNAPPSGRSWPLTAWTVVEFAESPFSALLPADAGEGFVRDVIYAAWGISFDSN